MGEETVWIWHKVDLPAYAMRSTQEQNANTACIHVTLTHVTTTKIVLLGSMGLSVAFAIPVGLGNFALMVCYLMNLHWSSSAFSSDIHGWQSLLIWSFGFSIRASKTSLCQYLVPTTLPTLTHFPSHSCNYLTNLDNLSEKCWRFLSHFH